MKAFDLYEAMDGVDDETVLRTVETYCRSGKKRRWNTLLAAAAAVTLMLALGAAAYASDFLGIRALLSGNAAPEGHSGVSLTAPQKLPDRTEERIRTAVETSRQAWAEWTDYRETRSDVRLPEALKNAPEDYTCIEETENPDGTHTLQFLNADYDQARDCLVNKKILLEAVLTEEEYGSWQKISQGWRYGDLDPAYGVMSRQDEEAITAIAEKYGLNLRGGRQIAWSSETTGMEGENFFTNDRLAEMTADMGCRGNLFYETPMGFDKVYWFDEGTFCVSYYMALPSSGKTVTCYARNNPYGTLTGGLEIGDSVKDPENFREESHIAPDGTRLTLLSDGGDAYVYGYLADSYFVMAVDVNPELVDGINRNAGTILTEEDLHYLADSLNYSLISKNKGE